MRRLLRRDEEVIVADMESGPGRDRNTAQHLLEHVPQVGLGPGRDWFCSDNRRLERIRHTLEKKGPLIDREWDVVEFLQLFEGVGERGLRVRKSRKIDAFRGDLCDQLGFQWWAGRISVRDLRPGRNQDSRQVDQGRQDCASTEFHFRNPHDGEEPWISSRPWP